MALLNNIYVLAANESVDNQVETTSHPTEDGLPISDTVRKQPITLSISGKIVDTDTLTAGTAVAKLKDLQKKGSLIKYVGQCGTFSNLQIQDFNTNYNYKNYGGADFDMTLKEVRIAKSAYVTPKSTKVTSQTKKIEVGDKVQFLGGSVYVASDAKKAAATRGKSVCRLTKISSLSGAKHIYHLISTDGRRVYGWVDASCVTAIAQTTSSSTNGGTQQVQSDSSKKVYYTVKKGDTLWKICYTTFRSKNLSMTEIMENNPKAFGTPGKANTLLAGARLLIE